MSSEKGSRKRIRQIFFTKLSQSRAHAAIFVFTLRIAIFRVQHEPLVLDLDGEDEGDGEETGGGEDIVKPGGPDTRNPEQREEDHSGDVEPDGDEASDHALRGGVAELHGQLHGEGHTRDHETRAWKKRIKECHYLTFEDQLKAA